MKRIVLLTSTMCIILALNSCVTRLGTFSVISTKNIDWSRANSFTRSTLDKKKGKDISYDEYCKWNKWLLDSKQKFYSGDITKEEFLSVIKELG